MRKEVVFNKLDVRDVPDVPGLVFRGFLGDEDFPRMVAIISGSAKADGADWVANVEDMAADYAHMDNCNVETDMIFAQVGDETVGYGRCMWWQVIDGPRVYAFFAQLLPQWRGKGIRRAMVGWLIDRIRAIAANDPPGQKFLQSWVNETETHWRDLLTSLGFEVVRYGLDMSRPLTGELPVYPVPEGFEIRRGTLAEFRQIWEAAREAFRDHWGASEWTEADYQAWQEMSTFNPSLWQVAWHGDEVAGGVLNFIDHQENAEYNRLRGYTETIFVRRPYRGQGLAKALIAASFQLLKNEGMTEAALGVDAENLSGALHLYRKMGFRKVKQGMTYRKELVL